jgi:hypothetical protein
MQREYDYIRRYSAFRVHDRMIDIGNAGSFNRIAVRNCDPPEEMVAGNTRFTSIHIIETRVGGRTFTAYRSEDLPEVLLAVWVGYPFNPQIEEGGDLMLQVLNEAPEIKDLVIDNTFVRSGWMNARMSQYLTMGWFPGLIQLGLRSFIHIQSGSYLGGESYKKFGETLARNIDEIARRLKREPFRYFPIMTSETGIRGRTDDITRESAFMISFDIVKSFRAAE